MDCLEGGGQWGRRCGPADTVASRWLSGAVGRGEGGGAAALEQRGGRIGEGMLPREISGMGLTQGEVGVEDGGFGPPTRATSATRVKGRKGVGREVRAEGKKGAAGATRAKVRRGAT